MVEERFEKLFKNVKVTKLETLEDYKIKVKDAIEKSFNETTFPTVFMEDDFKERILKKLGL